MLREQNIEKMQKKVKARWRCGAKSAGKESVLPPFPIQVTASLNLYRHCCFSYSYSYFLVLVIFPSCSSLKIEDQLFTL